MKTFNIFDGKTNTTLIANDAQEAVIKAGYNPNTMLRVEQVCDECQNSTKLVRADLCKRCWTEAHD